ncbi:hypothetical protein THRCLA_20851 [Thraustotheca clavata]|uniref:Crinkler effector protein N-terminal domain-containing protein n=1 Tax=Thraustotheca clavata TaxID=74557 RepID=A0A1W0A2Q7_9STRA|nr:hypothetical protein THRCLA_20851 [Thraustotheca clavata]
MDAVEVKLMCAVVGEESPFSIKIATNKTVDELKDEIKIKIMHPFAAKDLKLYLAIKDSNWFANKNLYEVNLAASNDISCMSQFKLMDPMDDISDYFDGNPPKKHIHVLVVYRKASKRKSNSSQILRSPKRSRTDDNLDKKLNWGFVTSSVDGVSLYEPIFPRDELINMIHNQVNQVRFVVLTSPAASGKTSTLILFKAKYPKIESIYVQMNSVEKSGFEILKSKKIDLQDEIIDFTVDPAKRYVFMLDDAQARYADTDFWHSLIKGSPVWLPQNISFIICATHVIDSGVESPTRAHF